MKLGVEPIFIKVVSALYRSIKAISTVAYISSGERSRSTELTDLMASFSSMPD
ncbi:hypothetical protein D3C75_1321590 [compost metagenome]